MTTKKKVELIGLVCERSVDFKDTLDENDCLKVDPAIKIIKVPCSGQIQPVMIETALKEGAEAVVACGCRIGDCHYREGNKFLRERLLGERMPKLKPTTDKRRILGLWLSAVETQKFCDEVCAFHQQVKQLPPLPDKAPAAKA